jgi:hypothetical protein
MRFPQDNRPETYFYLKSRKIAHPRYDYFIFGTADDNTHTHTHTRSLSLSHTLTYTQNTTAYSYYI